ncbi:MAG: autotransporter domain-containing protein [Magnetococcales bacterium]|nr:autotransporter domain-containing protein [Magnetococcales bacterium]
MAIGKSGSRKRAMALLPLNLTRSDALYKKEAKQLLNKTFTLPKASVATFAITLGILLYQPPLHAATDICTVGGSNSVSTAQADTNNCQLDAGESVDITSSGSIAPSDAQNVPAIFASSAVIGTISNSGTITSTNNSGIKLTSSVTVGNITNSGTISSSAASIHLTATITMNGNISNTGTINSSGGFGILFGSSSALTGDITNDGTITTDQTGIRLATASTINGNITNNGTITVSGTSNGDGIVLLSSSTVMTGTITNTGQINAYWNGIALYTKATLNGNISNSGSILASTSGFAGIDIFKTAGMTGNIINTGTVTGPSGIHLDLKGTITGNIDNSGTITGTANQTDRGGIALNSSLASITGSIINSGTITAPQHGILLATNSSITAGITNTGSIIGSSGNAITAMKTSNLNGGINNSGTIQGANYSISLTTGSGMDTAVTNNAGGSIAGLIRGTLDINNSGTLYLKTGTTSGSLATTGSSGASTMTGTYTQTSTGSLNMAVKNSTTFSTLTITGTANFPANASIVLDVKDQGAGISNGNTFSSMVGATTLNATTFTVTDNSALYDFTMTINGNTLDVTATSTPITIISPQAVGAATTLQTIVDGGNMGDDMNTVMNSLLSLNASEMDDAVTQTLPIMTGGLSNATSNAMHNVNRIVQARQTGAGGLSTGEDFMISGNGWAKTFGSLTDQSNRGGVTGYDATTAGLVLGWDKDISPHYNVGFATAYAFSNINGKNQASPQKARVKTNQLIAYGSRVIDPTLEANLQLDLSSHHNEGSRTINFGTISRIAEADYQSLSFHMAGGVGKVFKQNEHSSITTALRADYTVTRSERYVEQGANSLNLKVEESTSDELILGVDGKYTHKLDQNLAIAANLGAGYDFLADQGTVVAAYAAAPQTTFQTQGMETPSWIGKAGLGLTYDNTDNMVVNVHYDAEGREDYLNHTASLKLRLAF